MFDCCLTIMICFLFTVVIIAAYNWFGKKSPQSNNYDEF